MKTALVTGSSGLIGSEAVTHFDRRGYRVIGVDNNMRADFFGPRGDTTWNLKRLKKVTRHFDPRGLDIRDRAAMFDLVKTERPEVIVHCAAQPSHDLAASRPLDDFDVNAVGTLNLLEAARQHAAASPFVLMSTNKVYGDGPNRIALKEEAKRWAYADPAYARGIAEGFSIDGSLHSIFGASKVAADVMTQEYGRYFDMPTVYFRGGCLTGPSHSGVELHGFLSYLVSAVVRGITYTVYGYKGKQVRDQIHSADVLGAIDAFCSAPQPGVVYNLGGGTDNNCSILEAFEAVEALSGRKAKWAYSAQARRGDHICYISDLSKLRADYPAWSLQHSLPQILEEMVTAEMKRSAD
ncbi:MAG: NAD-dependent epimerase/dehydratase family protein [Gemmatimonadetes bacterium]|nr:NAD-dependent epimerase/dehydratase family protein [Gemmatimonadota bacterium]